MAKSDFSDYLPPRMYKQILRKISPAYLKIVHSVTLLGGTGKFFAQVVVQTQEGCVEGFGSAVSSDWRVAQRNATINGIDFMIAHFEHVRAQMNKPLDTCLSKHMISRFERHLAIEGGVWVEEAANPQANGRTKRLFMSMPEISYDTDPLSEIAVNYT